MERRDAKRRTDGRTCCLLLKVHLSKTLQRKEGKEGARGRESVWGIEGNSFESILISESKGREGGRGSEREAAAAGEKEREANEARGEQSAAAGQGEEAAGTVNCASIRRKETSWETFGPGKERGEAKAKAKAAKAMHARSEDG